MDGTMGIWRGGGRHKHSALIPIRATGARRHGRRRKRRGFQKKCFSPSTDLLLMAFLQPEPLKIAECGYLAVGDNKFRYAEYSFEIPKQVRNDVGF